MASLNPIICAHLTGIEVVGDLTPERGSNTEPDYFVIVYVDDTDVAESEMKPGAPSPRWEWQEGHRLCFQPSSMIKIVIYRKSNNLVTKHLVGQHSRKAVELLQNDATLDLKDETGDTIACQIKIKLSPFSEPELEGKSFKGPINSSMQEATMIASLNAMKLLRILAILPAGISPEDLAIMAPSINNIDEITGMLTDMSLASVRQGKHIKLLSSDKVRLLNYQQLDDDSRRNVYFFHFKLAEEGLRKPGDPLFNSAMQKLAENQPNIESVLMDALENGCIPAIEATLQYSSPRCAIKPRMDILQKAVQVAIVEETSKPETIARQDGTMALTARCMRRLGEMRIDAGIYEESRIKEMDYLAQAMERFDKLGDSNAVAYCQIYVAQRIWINTPDKGIQQLEQTRDDFIAMGDQAGAATCELRLGRYHLESRDAVPDAETAFQRALTQSIDAYHTALCNQLLSSIYIRVGRSDDARSLLDTTLKTLQNFGDRAAVAKCLSSMATLHSHSKQRDDACAALRQAIAELTWLGRDLDAAFNKWRLGKMCNDEEAVKLYQEAIPQFYASVFVFADAECRWDLGHRYMQMGLFSDALSHLEIARRQMVLNGTHHLATRCLLDIIQSMCSNGNTEGAKLMLEEKTPEIRRFLIQHEKLGDIQEESLKLAIENEELRFSLEKPGV